LDVEEEEVGRAFGEEGDGGDDGGGFAGDLEIFVRFEEAGEFAAGGGFVVDEDNGVHAAAR
jgi:hypothetical protein